MARPKGYDYGSLPKPLRSKDARVNYGRKAAMEVKSGVDARSGLQDRWKKNEDNYRNINSGAVELVPGATPYAIPLIQPLLDRINGTVYQSIVGVEPWVQVLPDMDDQGIGDSVERDLQYLMARAKFPRKLWGALKITSCTNCGIIRLRYENTVGFVMEVVHPNDFFVYPASATSLDLAKSCGHRFFRTVEQIKAKQKSGEWMAGDFLATNDPLQHESGRNKAYSRVENNVVDNEDESVELWEVYRLEDYGDGSVWYKCVVAVDSMFLLDCRPFGVTMETDAGPQFVPYSSPDYFDLRYDDEYGIFWPSGSPAQNLQGIQNLYNDGWNIWYWGNVSTAFPATVISGGTMGKKLEKLVPGAIIENPSPIQAQVINTQFNGQAFPMILAQLEQIAEGAVRISRLAIGKELKSHTTATAAAGQLELQRQSEDQYTAYISLGLQRLYTFAYELYRLHHTDIVNTFGAAIEIHDPMMLESLRFNFEVNGKNSTNNPQALIQKLQMLLAMATTPNTTLNYQMVEQAVVRAMQLPFNARKMAIQPQQAAQGLIGAATGGDLDPELAGALQGLDEGTMDGILQQLTALEGSQEVA